MHRRLVACAFLHITRSAYYRWLTHPKSNREQENERIADVVFQGTTTLRNVPSAGARHAFETYLLINNVGGIIPGLYRFLALDHSLISVSLGTAI